MIAVHIVISDRNWILERLAKEIADRLDYVSYDTEPDPGADIQYYMTYSTRRDNKRVSEREIAFFTHLEERHEQAKEWYFNAAKDVDYAVCMSKRYADMLEADGVENVAVISPGVDLERFYPKLRIAVVGRTYVTGRKGEDVVEQVMDLPGIDWHFTGAGWPKPGRHVPEADLPDFYRSMDYVLVPAYYEGGPMCVLEALACGVEVIATPVGWVPDYPHIEFETGNADDLRRVLLELLEKKHALAASVANVTWNAWAEGHDKLFREVAASLPERPAAAATAKTSELKAGLWVAQLEKKAKGGPTVRVANTIRQLRRLGVVASPIDGSLPKGADYSVVHAFNISPPEQTETLVLHARAEGIPVVVSPILLDYTERHTYEVEVPRVYAKARSSKDVDEGLRAIRERRADEIAAGMVFKEHGHDTFAKVRRVLEGADRVISLSLREKELLVALGTPSEKISVVHNPAQTDRYTGGDPELFEQTYGVRDFVLCVARKEARKNQLGLVYALRDSGIPIVLIGHPHEPQQLYHEQLTRWGGPNVHMIDRLDPGSPLLASAYAASRVFVLPSYSEGASLAALEAGAAGCNLVLSNRSSEQEYFGDLARYCDPADPGTVREAVLSAYESPANDEQRERLKALVRERFSYERYASDTLAVYEQAIAEAASQPGASLRAKAQPRTIYVDLSTGGERRGSLTGVTRVEQMCAIELKKRLPERVRLVKWHKALRKYLPLSLEQVQDRSYMDNSMTLSTGAGFLLDGLSDGTVEFERDSIFLLMGSSWNANHDYLHDLAKVKHARGLKLVTCMYDLMPVQFPHFTPASYAKAFARNLRTVLNMSDRLLSISEATARAVLDYATANPVTVPDLSLIRLGDELVHDEPLEGRQRSDTLSFLADTPFVLTVSTITPRKNFDMLYQIWLRLLQEHGDSIPHLVIVGKEGYNSSTMLTTLAHDVNVQPVLHVLNDIDDADLSWLYRNCLLTVYPTLYEGWGLPVAESLSYGKVTIASNVSSVPEIAPELTELLDPQDFMQWYVAISSYLFDPRARERREAEIREGFKTTTWSSLAETVLTHIDRPFVKPQVTKRLKAGDTVSFVRSSVAEHWPVETLGTAGWSHTEANGTWTCDRCATLALPMEAPSGDFLVLSAQVRPFRPRGVSEPLDVTVLANGHMTAQWFVTRESEQRAVIPSAVFEDSEVEGELGIEFRIANPLLERPVDGSRIPAPQTPLEAGNRLLGLYFSELTVDTPMVLGNSGTAIEHDATDAVKVDSIAAHSGWQADPVHGLRTTSYTATFIVPVEQAMAASGGVLDYRLNALGCTAGTGLEIDVLVNGQHRANHYLFDPGPHDLRLFVSPSLIADREQLCVTIQIRNPLFTGKSNDAVGVALHHAKLVPLRESAVSPYTLGDAMDFGVLGNATDYTVGGWGQAQVDGTWTAGSESALLLAPEGDTQGSIALSLRARPFLSHVAPIQEVEVVVNGENVATWKYRQPAPVTYTALLPNGLVAGPTHVRLLPRYPVSPYELGLGIDDKPRGLFVEQLTLASESASD